MHNALFPGKAISTTGRKDAMHMIEQDTVKLLRECDAGVKMGVESIEEVMDKAEADGMRKALFDCRSEHVKLGHEIQSELDRFQDEGKNPNPMAEKMSWIKTEAMLLMKNCDATIADLMTDGCNMGVKSLNRYLNQYEAASERSKDIAKRLIHQEQTLAESMRAYL